MGHWAVGHWAVGHWAVGHWAVVRSAADNPRKRVHHETAPRRVSAERPSRHAVVATSRGTASAQAPPLRFHAPWFVPTPRGGSPAEVAVTAPVCWSAAGRCSRMRHASTGIRPSGHRRPHPQTPALAASRPAENAMVISRLADYDLGFHLRAAPRRAATIVGAITVATSARHPGPPTSRFPTPPTARQLSRRSRPCRRTFACEEPRPCPAFQKCGS